MLRPSILLALLGVVSKTLACEIPDTPLSNNITEGFSIYVQNASIPAVHNRIMNFRPNGFDKHLVLRPEGEPTYDTLYLVNGYLTYEDKRAVIDLEYNPDDDTLKMFMTDRTYYPYGVFQPAYSCNPDTDELEIILELVVRLADPPVYGGNIGIQTAGTTYEFRYTPPNNPLLNERFMHVNMVVFRDGLVPPQPSSTTATPTPTPTTPSTIGDYNYVSCWADPDGGRALSTVTSATDMTNEKCAIACGGTEYFGTQWSVECWCGSTLNAASVAAPESDCSNTCGGNATQTCGGGRRLSLYKLKSNGTNPVTTTSAPVTSTSAPGTSTSTTAPGTSTTTLVTSATTLVTSTSAPGTSTTTRVTSTSQSTGPTTGPTDTASIGAFNFVSCYAEPADGRALSDASTSSGTMTNQVCAAFCSDYPYFGTEWSRECYCGTEITAGSAVAPASDCASNPCVGDATQRCGGSRRLSLYSNPNWTGPTLPPDVGGYEWYGCVTDTPAARSLTAKFTWSATMTLETCAAYCSGNKYFGTEYGMECYCGNTFAATADEVAIGQCSMTCAGDATQKCGAAGRMSVYEVIET